MATTPSRALRASTTQAPNSWVRIPATTKPTKIAAPSMNEDHPLAETRSPGPRASRGRVEKCDGRTENTATVVAVPPMSTTHNGASTNSTTAVSPAQTATHACVRVRARPRGRRSRYPARSGTSTMAGSCMAKAAIPTSSGAPLGVGDQEDRQPPGELGEAAEPVGHQDAAQPRITGQGEQRSDARASPSAPLPA